MMAPTIITFVFLQLFQNEFRQLDVIVKYAQSAG